MQFDQNRVWMIGWEYPPHNSGGLGVACQGLTQSLADCNTQIFFTLPYTLPGSIGHMEIVECIDPTWLSGDPNLPPFSSYLMPNLPKNKKIDPNFPDAHQLASLPQSDLEIKVSQYANLVTQQAQKHSFDFDVIHAHDWMSFPAALKLKMKSDRPMIAHIHSTEHDRIPSGYGSSFIHQTEYEGLTYADKVIAVSQYTRHVLIQEYGIDPNKIEVVHNGISPSETPIDPGTHHFASKRPVVVFMGRLTGQKGPEYFLILAQRVLQELPSALFIVAGSGDLYHQLLLSAANQRLSASLLFSGFVRDNQREKLLDRADLFVMPSLSEPFGLVALEAAERHTPVIISKNSGVQEVLQSALAIDFWDIDKMTNSIVEILTDKEKKQEIIDRQLNEVKQVTWNSAATKVKDIYRKILAKNQ